MPRRVAPEQPSDSTIGAGCRRFAAMSARSYIGYNRRRMNPRPRWLVVLALALAAGGGGAAEPECARGDKPCVLKRVHAHPAKQSAHWKPALARPLAERIGAGPPELVEFLAFDVAANELPNRPRASSPDPAFLTDVRRALDGIPAAVRKLLEGKLAGIYFVDDIGGTGFTDSTSDEKLGFIVLDPAVLAKQTANAWASWKDNTPFRPDSEWRLETRIADESRDDRVHAIQFILLHEIGHVLSIGAKAHPSWNQSLSGVAPGEYGFFDLSWTVKGGRYASKFDAAFPKRRDVRFYFGAKLDAREMRGVYEALERTSFPTLYAATHPADDFAESFASYVHVAMMGRDHEVRLYRKGKLEKAIRACWGQARCASKRTALERVLGLPVTR